MDDKLRESFEKDFQIDGHVFYYGEDGYYHTDNKKFKMGAVTLNRILYGYRKGYKKRTYIEYNPLFNGAGT